METTIICRSQDLVDSHGDARVWGLGSRVQGLGFRV